MTIKTAQHWIGGQWVSGHDGTRESIDPATGDVIGNYDLGSAALANNAVAAAKEAFETTQWSSRPRLRADILWQFADQIERRKEEIADLVVAESGKLYREALGETLGAISEARYYAGLARSIQGRVSELDHNQQVIFTREAAGVSAIIVPWNAPVTLLVRSLAPAMAAGCTAVVKPAPQTPHVNRLMMECLASISDLPQGVVNSVNENGIVVGQCLAEHPDIDVISFTGASATGKKIMASASDTLKRLSLELGGKAPTLITDSADLDAAIPVITANATVIAGQMCTAITRVITTPGHYDEVAERLRQSLSAVVTGPGNDPTSTMGAIIDHASRDRLLEAVALAESEGKVLLRGEAPTDPLRANGAFITPTLMRIDDVNSPLVQEELFGPILNIEVADTESEMIARANATRYGLASSVWTSDVKQAQRLSRRIRAGSVWINTHNRLGAETETGGFKQSGLGRLHGLEGLADFLETKTVFQETDDI